MKTHVSLITAGAGVLFALTAGANLIAVSIFLAIVIVVLVSSVRIA